MRSTSNNFPKEWKIVRLEDVAEVSSGNTAPQNRIYFENGKYPFIRVQHINTLIENKYPVIYDLVNDLAVKKLKLKVFRKGSIIFPKSGESIKLEKRAILKEDSCVVNHLAVIEVFSNDLDANFLFYYLSNIKTSNYLSKTTMPSLNLSVIKSFSVPLPPLPEQRKIAEILSTVDDAIQKVDEAIAKTERLKRGLMQKLLTNGIGHKEFKDTEIGRIPKEWEVVKLQDIVSEIKNGFASGKRDENGIVQVRMNNVTTDGRLTFDSYIKVPPPENLEKWILKPGDLLFNNTNSYDLVGKSAIFETAPFPCTFSNHFTRIRFKEGVVPKIILWHFLMLWRRGYFKSVAIRHVGQSAVHTQYLLRLKIPLPPLPEQRKIAEILSTVDKKSELERKRKEKLEHIRRGLMNDLLTGKRRIKL